MVALLPLGPHTPCFGDKVGPIRSRAGLGAEAQADGAGELQSSKFHSCDPGAGG